jgi:hypothetical protein
LAALALAVPASGAGIKPLSPQPKAEALNDGLAVSYYFAIYNSIEELTSWMDHKKGKPGEPIPTLNYKVGQGKVLTSDSSNFVGAHITGLINLAKAGTYAFEVTSNDGVRLTLGGKMIFEDPEVHADWTSEPIVVPVTEPGWYPIDVLYFEKKNTSTLIVKWKPPGAAGFEVVPAEAYKNTGPSS